MATITKTTCELYKLRGLPHGGWAEIAIDAAEQHGRIQIASDWGSWQYFWSHCGKPFKAFLLEVELPYVATKFGEDRYFDLKGTVKQYRQDILRRRWETYEDKKSARTLWSETSELATCDSREEFLNHAYNDCPKLVEMYDGCLEIHDRINPRFEVFWRDCWPVFTEHIKAEIGVPAEA